MHLLAALLGSGRQRSRHQVHCCRRVQVQGSSLRDLGSVFGVQGSGFMFLCHGFRVQDSEFSVQCSVFSVQGSEFRFHGSGFRADGSVFSVQCSVFRAWG